MNELEIDTYDNRITFNNFSAVLIAINSESFFSTLYIYIKRFQKMGGVNKTPSKPTLIHYQKFSMFLHLKRVWFILISVVISITALPRISS